MKWEHLGFGRAAVLYRRTQIVLNAARLLPAHRRLPHKALLSGLWWKLLSIQPLQLLAALPMLGFLRQATQPTPVHFAVNGFSAGSYTGAVIGLAIRCLWPHCQITVCDWKPSDRELQMLQQTLHITYVEESARWMGSCKHKYWHWLHCQLPQGRFRLTDLKLSHPAVIPDRDRMAAPMRLASWIRFETLMASTDWEGAIGMLVSNLHQSDQELLRLLQMCVPGQTITSMEEAQALLLQRMCQMAH